MALRPHGHVQRLDFGRRLEPVGDVVVHGAGQDPEEFSAYYAAVGADIKPRLYMTYVDLRANMDAYFASLDRELAAYLPKRIQPQIGLYFTGAADEHHHPERHYEDEVADGRHDGQIDAFCDGLRRLNRPAFVRIGFEFNGPWFGYAPDAYKAAWVRIVSALRRHALEEVAAVWCYCPLPSTREEPDAGRINRDYVPYYPGDAWVDWWAIDLFSPDTFHMENTHWFVHDARQAQFPVMIGESTPRWVGGVQAGAAAWNAWFAPYFHFIRSTPVVKAFCYINRDWGRYPVWRDWGDARIHENHVILDQYTRELAYPLYRHAMPDPP